MRVCPECGLRTEAANCPKDGLVTLDEAVLDSRDPLLDRTIAGKYIIEAHLGSGGMGAVYRARHAETGGLVAVKVMIPDRQSRSTAVKRFALEAQNAAVLRQAHTVRVLDFGTDDELMFLVMEFLEGESLHACLEREHSLAWRRALSIARQVLLALWEAHEHPRRIVHRDIKPANVLLCKQVGSDDFIKVVDFGVARSLEGSGAGTAGAIGTPHAMAPEQWGGDADARSDLYSVGCMLFEMLAGRPPFVAPPSTAQSSLIVTIAAMHMHSTPPPLSQLAPGVPIGLCRVVHALLAKQPDERPATAAAVIELLDSVAAGEQLDALAAPLAQAEAAAEPLLGGRRPSGALVSYVALGGDSQEETYDADGATQTLGSAFDQIGADIANRAMAKAISGATPSPGYAERHAGHAASDAIAATPATPAFAPAARSVAVDAADLVGADTGVAAGIYAAPRAAAAAVPAEALGTPTPAVPPFDPLAADAEPAPRPARRRPAPAQSKRQRPAPTRAAAGRGGQIAGWLVLLVVVLCAVGAWLWKNGRLGGGAVAAETPASVAEHAIPALPPRVEVAEAASPTPTPAPERAPAGKPAPPLPVVAASELDEGAHRAEAGIDRPEITYIAHLSAADHKSSSGRKLGHAADVVVQDRVNVHEGRHRDDHDQLDSRFAKRAERDRLKRLLRRALTKDASARILGGEPRIEVQVWRDSVLVSFLR